MAFNFFGAIAGKEKFEEFEEFVLIESKKINKKIDSLNREKLRFLELLDKFKLSDQELRSEYSLSERADIDYIKNPRPSFKEPPLTLDTVNSTDVNYLKKMVLDQIKYKRENNEFTIKKIRDRVEQIDNEISFLTDGLNNYQTTLSNIKSRFNIEDFAAVMPVAPLDPKDVDDNIPVTPKNSGREVIDGYTYYLPLSLKSFNKTITFDTAAPTVKSGQLISIINGKNTGFKTVARVISSTTIEVYEDLVDESPATSKVRVI